MTSSRNLRNIAGKRVGARAEDPAYQAAVIAAAAAIRYGPDLIERGGITEETEQETAGRLDENPRT